MKTFKKFIEEAYLLEMRKEDKVKGKQKTPLEIERTRIHKEPGSVKKTPEGKWKVTPPKKTEVKDKTMNPAAQMGRFAQGMGHNPVYGSAGGAGYGYTRHPHGGGGSGAQAPGSARSVKRTQTIQQRRGPTGTTAVERIRQKRQKAEYKGYEYKK